MPPLRRLTIAALALSPWAAAWAMPVTVQLRDPQGQPLAGAALDVEVIDIKLYAGTPAEPIVFDKPGVATLGCNIHDRMSAHVVDDTPRFARTDDKGEGEASFDLPPGEHVVKAWHAGQKAPTLQSVKLDVPAGGGTVVLALAE